jgi:predicted DNA-binding transcriptional regulator AlpA
MPLQGHTGTSSSADAQSVVAMARVVSSAEAAAFCGISQSHWMRLNRLGQVPAPVRLGARKLGWRIGSLVNFVNERAA